MSIVITDLCKSFGSTPVLQHFTWTVDRPMVLMGRSGCGKTTLLRILLGLESAVRRLGPAVIRLNFTTENQEETARTIRAFADGFLRGQEVSQPCRDFTRGHFKRGVQ